MYQVRAGQYFGEPVVSETTSPVEAIKNAMNLVKEHSQESASVSIDDYVHLVVYADGSYARWYNWYTYHESEPTPEYLALLNEAMDDNVDTHVRRTPV